MGDDPSDDVKLELLWRDYEKRQTSFPAPPGMLGVPDRLIVIILIIANMLGMGPSAIESILKGLGK